MFEGIATVGALHFDTSSRVRIDEGREEARRVTRASAWQGRVPGWPRRTKVHQPELPLLHTIVCTTLAPQHLCQAVKATLEPESCDLYLQCQSSNPLHLPCSLHPPCLLQPCVHLYMLHQQIASSPACSVRGNGCWGPTSLNSIRTTSNLISLVSVNVKGYLAQIKGADVVLRASGSADMMVYMETWLGEGWSAQAIEDNGVQPGEAAAVPGMVSGSAELHRLLSDDLNASHPC